MAVVEYVKAPANQYRFLVFEDFGFIFQLGIGNNQGIISHTGNYTITIMRLTTEVVDEKQKAIVISKKNFGFIPALKKMLEDSSVEYFFSSRSPTSFEVFDYCFLVNEPVSESRAKEYPDKKFVHILFGAKDRSTHRPIKHSNVKVIGISGHNLEPVDLEKVLWFAFSKTKEQYLFLED